VFPVAKKLSVTSTFTRAGIAKFILMYSCVRLHYLRPQLQVQVYNSGAWGCINVMINNGEVK